MATVPCVEDSCSLDLEITGANKLTGSVILDPNGGLECSAPDGVGVLLDPDACNALSLSAAGLHMPEYDSDFSYVACNTGNGTTGVTVTPGLGSAIDVDAFAGAYGTTLTEFTTRVSIIYTNTSCRPVNLRVGYVLGYPQFFLVNGWSFAIGTRNEYQGVPTVPSVRYDTRSSPFVGGGSSLDLTMPGIVQEATDTVPVGGVRTATISLFAQAIQVGPASTSGFSNQAQVFFNAGLLIQTWTYS